MCEAWRFERGLHGIGLFCHNKGRHRQEKRVAMFVTFNVSAPKTWVWEMNPFVAFMVHLGDEGLILESRMF